MTATIPESYGAVVDPFAIANTNSQIEMWP
jgi:hypothetical protein